MQMLHDPRTTIRRVRQRMFRFLSRVAGQRMTLEKVVLVVAPHPDDETLGCGGLITRIVREGGRVHVIVLTGGERSHVGCCALDGQAVRQARRELAMKAAECLSLAKDHVMFLDWGDGRIGRNDPAESGRRITELAEWISQLRPQAIFAPHPFEGWTDHEMAEQITRAAAKQSRVRCRLFHYCVWFWFSMPLRKAMWLDWHKAHLLDIRGVYEQKQAAVDTYLSPCAPCGNPWSGVLPPELIHASWWEKELFFEATR